MKDSRSDLGPKYASSAGRMIVIPESTVITSRSTLGASRILPFIIFRSRDTAIQSDARGNGALYEESSRI